MRLIKMIGILVLATIGAGPAVAADPPLVPFEANLADAQGDPLAGTFKMHFRIYDDPQGDTVIWNEEHTTASVVYGRLNVILGDINSLAAIDFSTPKYLAIQVGDEGVEMLPRHQLVPAFHASVADVALSVAAGVIAADSVGTAEIAANAVTGAQLAPNSVGPSNIIDGAVGAAEIAADVVGASEIAPYAVGNSELGFLSSSFNRHNSASQSSTSFTTGDSYRFCALTETTIAPDFLSSSQSGCGNQPASGPVSGPLTVSPWTIYALGIFTDCEMSCFAVAN